MRFFNRKAAAPAADSLSVTENVPVTGTCNGPRRHKLKSTTTCTRLRWQIRTCVAEVTCPECEWGATLSGTAGG